ncbi:hypothetical protein MLD38_002076 [Melastoma candidum]|uniref:Uncharacterized protein n=1 Tax=Melastoma candidum TaxID=119954 RepID=A0ACB9SF76_9MYRT|nr:hypothetical protein MLD38_002076 [Melastoma candidum]
MGDRGGAAGDGGTSLIDKIHGGFPDVAHFAASVATSRTSEVELVRGVLQILQGLSSNLFHWDDRKMRFCAKFGVHVSHLSTSSLHAILGQFSYAASCLKLVDVIIDRVNAFPRTPPPTLRAFLSSVSSWVLRLRDMALREEEKISSSNNNFAPTLLGLASSISSLCSGAEFLLQVLYGSLPLAYFEPLSSISAAEVAVHILDSLYVRLDEACLVQGGQEEAYQVLLHLFVGSVLPYIQVLDSWLYQGILDDPFEELFFYANSNVSIKDADFWDRSYLLKTMKDARQGAQRSSVGTVRDYVASKGDKRETKEGEFSAYSKANEWSENGNLACPLFIKGNAKSIVSAGKSLQLIQHTSPATSSLSRESFFQEKDLNDTKDVMEELTLAESFCTSLASIIGDSNHLTRDIVETKSLKMKFASRRCDANDVKVEKLPGKGFYADSSPDNSQEENCSITEKSECDREGQVLNVVSHVSDSMTFSKFFCPENPVITVCQMELCGIRDALKSVNISENFYLPSLNDEILHKLVFGEEFVKAFRPGGMDCMLGFQFSEHEYCLAMADKKEVEKLFPFPTILPSYQDIMDMSRLLPFQRNSTILSRVISQIRNRDLAATPLPSSIMQECLLVYIEKQAHCIGNQILSKLMQDWGLIDELAVLRAIYLLGSGDLLQHFLAVTFSKLERGETWEDDFELNTILQESIRNSADGNLLSAPDSLIVNLNKNEGVSGHAQHSSTVIASTTRKGLQVFGAAGLDSLKFTYKVSWPLELIVNAEAIRRYSQVMGFLLKVKHAKYVLDKARKWMWKAKGTTAYSSKRHLLLQHKLLHFIDAFHQYVMDRVYHSAWLELCEGMAAASSLDEVMEVHESYLLSIQRQCFVVPDKLWALIASRINSILGLAVEFYSIQQTLNSGGAVAGVKAKCEAETERIEKQFDECITFLLRILSFKLNIGHFPHLADLVTRINYNYHYMSDGGNMKTPSGNESASSRFGKAFPGRTD